MARNSMPLIFLYFRGGILIFYYQVMQGDSKVSPKTYY